MKKRNLLCLSCLLVWPVLTLGQNQAPALTARSMHSKPGDPVVVNPGDPVVIEVNVTPDRDTRISWRSSGDGKFQSDTENKKSVTFVPATPGQAVIIICDVSVPGRQDHPSATFVVAGAQPPPPVKPVPTPALQINPQAHHPGDMLLADMENMVPSGYMGDAMAENNGAAVLDSGNNQGCLPGSVSCIRIDYTPANGHVGWAAFAWQHVLEGSDNWGQSLGTNYSAGGYRSLRVDAKGTPDESGIFPKVQFKSGGNVAPTYKDNRATYAVAGPTVQLRAQFQEYCLSLEGRDLSNTVSPFTVVFAKAGNARTIVVVLDDVRFSTQPCN